MVKASRSSRGTDKTRGEKMLGSEMDAAGSPAINPRVQREIGKHLRAHYDDLVSEPVPDRFIELLRQLEKSVTRKG
jgi:Anti-sigma factor NepR